MSRKRPAPKIRRHPAGIDKQESSRERQRMTRRAKRTIGRAPPTTPQEAGSPPERMGLGERMFAWGKVALTGMWKQDPWRRPAGAGIESCQRQMK